MSLKRPLIMIISNLVIIWPMTGMLFRKQKRWCETYTAYPGFNDGKAVPWEFCSELWIILSCAVFLTTLVSVWWFLDYFLEKRHKQKSNKMGSEFLYWASILTVFFLVNGLVNFPAGLPYESCPQINFGAQSCIQVTESGVRFYFALSIALFLAAIVFKIQNSRPEKVGNSDVE